VWLADRSNIARHFCVEIERHLLLIGEQDAAVTSVPNSLCNRPVTHSTTNGAGLLHET